MGGSAAKAGEEPPESLPGKNGRLAGRYPADADKPPMIRRPAVTLCHPRSRPFIWQGQSQALAAKTKRSIVRAANPSARASDPLKAILCRHFDMIGFAWCSALIVRAEVLILNTHEEFLG